MRLILLLSAACFGLMLCPRDASAAPLPISSSQVSKVAVDTRFIGDFAVTRGFSLGRPLRPRFTPDGRAVLFLRSEARSPVTRLYEFDVVSGTERILLTPEQLLDGGTERLSPEEAARRERMRIDAKGFTGFELSEDGTRVLVSLSGKLYLLDRREGRVRALPIARGTLLDPKFSPDGRHVSYVLDADLYVLDLDTLGERRLTIGGGEDFTHGLAEFVAQEEMGRFAGYWWSPDSRQIAYEEADAREVEVWQPADPARPDQTPASQRYPRPGKANVKVRLGVIPADGGETTWISWDRERYPYLATVRWQDGPLTLLVQNRLQQEMLLLAADPQQGKTRVLLVEKDTAWLNLDQDVPKWLPGGVGFLWTSESAGARRLELRNPDGSLDRVLAGPETGYLPESNGGGFLAFSFDPLKKQVYFRASTVPTESHLYRVGITGDGMPERLSTGSGIHQAVFAPDHTLYAENTGTLQALQTWTVRRIDGTAVGPLASVAEEPPFLPRTEIVKVEGFYCSLTRPREFKTGRRYPVIVDVYGGPGVVRVVASLGRGASLLRAQWLADQGFIVVSIDGRGTPGRGRAWERAIRGNFGRVPLEDQVRGLQALGKRYPELDLERVGITGWSFGGYMAALAILQRPDVFKAAVAGAPVIDWLDYDTHYTERYLGLPELNPEGYRDSSLLTYADQLRRPLLLVHGTSDDNVFFLHSLKLSDRLFRAGKEHEVLPLSGFTHMVNDPEVRERLEERIVGFFEKHL